jgi:hypothetical protein
LRKLLRSVRDSLKGKLKVPQTTLTEEEREDMVNQLVERIANNGLEYPALILLETIKPLCQFTAQSTLILWAPILEPWGIPANRYGLLFEDRDNIELIINRIEELTDKKM